MYTVRRDLKNPIISPLRAHEWEALSTFNGCPILVGSKLNILYRAMSLPEQFGNETFSLSTIGRTTSNNKGVFSKREQFIVPEEAWERYGCEDPRVTKVGSKYYTFYTALSGYPFGPDSIKVAVAISKDMKTVDERHLVTPFNAKAMALFPEKINGKFVAILSVNTDRPPATIALAEFDKEEDIWSDEYWKTWYKELPKHALEIPRYNQDHVEVGTAPIKTKDGWLLVYSHMQNYGTDKIVFGIEAILLDLKNPKKIIGKTVAPILIPEESYEMYGIAPKIVFPSGCTVKDGDLHIYYGGADTVCARARVNLAALLESIRGEERRGLERLNEFPLLSPIKDHAWESKAVFNPAAIYLKGKFHILYRAMSDDNTSVVGYASSINGYTIDERLPDPIYVPRTDAEAKKIPGGNSGCEDPRIMQIGEDIYMCYTAYNGIQAPAIALTHISVKDFINKKWNWSVPIIISHDGVDDKDAAIFPEKIKGSIGLQYALLHRVSGAITLDFSPTLDFANHNSYKNIPIIQARRGMWDSKKVGISAPPIKTAYGWLLLYHGIGEDGTYRTGAAMIDLKNPFNIIGRTTDFILEPVRKYDIEGIVPHVVFPCGAAVKGDDLFVYYGGADTVTDVAKTSLKKLVHRLLE